MEFNVFKNLAIRCRVFKNPNFFISRECILNPRHQTEGFYKFKTSLSISVYLDICLW